MPRKKNEKALPSLEPSFEEILVCDNKKMRSHIEICTHQAEHVEQQRLGTLLGIFEVTDSSEDSSYIVNYIISVIKKEYFCNPKRGVLESFEAALHKANVALSKLAEHGNVKWIGTFNAVAAVIEKNNLHLSQSGSTRALLFRSKSLTDISEGLSATQEPHPLKTFIDVSSGRLEEHDILIITTENIFDIFSFEEIKKSLLRFSEEELLQFLKTALGNELETSAVLITHIREKEPLPAPSPSRSARAYSHAWSAQAFAKKQSSPPKKTSENIKRDILKNKEELTRQKTGHLYIKADEQDQTRDNPAFSKYLSDYFSAPGERTSAAWSNLKSTLKKSSSGTKYKIKNLSLPQWNLKIPRLPKISFPKITLPFFSSVSNVKETMLKLKSLIAHYARRIFHRVSSLTKKQKLYGVSAIAALLVMPYIFLKIKNYSQEKNLQAAAVLPAQIPREEAGTIPVPVPGPNTTALSDLENIPMPQPASSLVYLDGNSYGVTSTSIINLEDRSSFSAPEEFGEIILAAAMDDLRLIFIFNAKKEALSFSPLSKKFQSNSLAIPENTSLYSAGTYLTYLYLLDSQNNQIYRYPRAEGGFGEKINWLKETAPLQEFQNMAINENIFLTNGKEILKFFKGKRQEFSISSLIVPLQPALLFAQEDEPYLFALDIKNKRVVKIDANTGAVLAQYYHPKLEEVKKFIVDEANQALYLLDKSGDVKKVTI